MLQNYSFSGLWHQAADEQLCRLAKILLTRRMAALAYPPCVFRGNLHLVLEILTLNWLCGR